MDKTSQFDANNYKFNTESKNGIYLIHGFTNTTYELKMLAEYLSKEGYHSVTNNLPGHGTTIAECNKTKYTDWLEAAEQGVAKLASTCDKIHIVGSSMGAVIALHLATIFPLDSIVIVAPVFKFRSEFKTRVLVPLFNKIIPKIKKSSQYPGGENMQFYGYTHYPNKALNELRKLTNLVIKKLPDVKCPMLMLYSQSDLTCVMDNYDIVNDNVSCKIKKKLILKNSSHNMLSDGKYIEERQLIYKTITNFISEY